MTLASDTPWARERTDLADSEPETLRALAEACSAWRIATAALTTEPIDPATEERLRALGYIR